MPDYQRLAATAQRLTQANGRAITLVRQSDELQDPRRPWLGPAEDAAEVTLPLYGVFVPPNTVRQFGLTALGEGTEFDDLVARSQQIIITAQGQTDIREYTEVEDDNLRWGIIGIQTLTPGPTTLLAFIGVRR